MVNVVDPDTRQVGSIPSAQLPDALNQGFTLASPEQVAHHFKEQDYGTPGQQAIAGLEGFAQGVAGPVATAAERLAGVSSEGIEGRAEINPGTHMATMVGGLAAPALLAAGTGLAARAGIEGAAGVAAAVKAGSKFTQAGLLEKAGPMGAKLLGLPATEEALQAAGTVAKIGSAAARGAVDNAIFQSGDELSKTILQDPNQSVQTAALSVGLAAAIGGVFGAGLGSVQPLWKATMGGKLGSMLHAVQERMGGIEGVVPSPIRTMLAKTGIELAPEQIARLEGAPEIQQIAKTLEQSDTTKAGLNYQESFKKAQNDLQDVIVKTLGKDPETLAHGELSNYEVGKKLAHSLAEEYQAKLDPTIKAFEEYRTKYADTPLEPSIGAKGPEIEAQQAKLEKQLNRVSNEAQRAMKAGNPEAAIEAAGKLEDLQGQLRMMESQKASPGTIDKISEAIGATAQHEGWTASPSSDIMKEIARIQRELPLQKNLKDLQHYISAVGDNMQHDRLGNGPLYRAGGILKGILKDAEAGVLENAVGAKEGSAALEQLKSARLGYRAQSELKEALDSRLHAGGSTSNYAKALREMGSTDGESLLNRISGRGDADALALLQENFPKSADLLKQYHIDAMLEKAGKQSANGRMGLSQSVKNSLEAMSPELRSFTLRPEQLEKIEAVHGILNEFKNMPHNFSNTARTMDKLFSYLPGSVVGAAAWLTGHNPAIALALAPLTKILSKDAPDAARLALLKFLGSNKPIESGAFKAAVDFLDHAAKGEDLMTKAAKNIFSADSKVLPDRLIPTERERIALDKQLQRMATNPQDALQSNSPGVGHYLEEHGQAQSQFAMQTAQFLNSLRPNTTGALPLDAKRVVSSSERAAFDRVLNVAQQPLMALHYIKQGNITPQDIGIVRRLYPAAYDQMAKKIQNEILDKVSKGETIPYKTRIGISMFLGSPVDSTMTPAGIMGAQPTPVQQPQGSPTKKGDAALNKESKSTMTQSQRREYSPPGKQ